MEQPRLTEDQRERLRPYEQQLHQAYYASYCTGMSAAKTSALFAIYEEVYHAKAGCPVCPVDIVNVAKRLGRLFFATSEANAPEVAQLPTLENKTPQKAKKAKITNPKK